MPIQLIRREFSDALENLIDYAMKDHKDTPFGRWRYLGEFHANAVSQSGFKWSINLLNNHPDEAKYRIIVILEKNMFLAAPEQQTSRLLIHDEVTQTLRRKQYTALHYCCSFTTTVLRLLDTAINVGYAYNNMHIKALIFELDEHAAPTPSVEVIRMCQQCSTHVRIDDARELVSPMPLAPRPTRLESIEHNLYNNEYISRRMATLLLFYNQSTSFCGQQYIETSKFILGNSQTYYYNLLRDKISTQTAILPKHPILKCLPCFKQTVEQLVHVIMKAERATNIENDVSRGPAAIRLIDYKWLSNGIENSFERETARGHQIMAYSERSMPEYANPAVHAFITIECADSPYDIDEANQANVPHIYDLTPYTPKNRKEVVDMHSDNSSKQSGSIRAELTPDAEISA